MFIYNFNLYNIFFIYFFQCIRDSKLISYVKPHTSSSHDHEDHNHHHNHHNHHSHGSSSEHDHEDHESKNCSDTSEGCALAHTHVEDEHNEYFNYTLSHADIFNVCPVLLYQLTSNSDANNQGCIEEAILVEINEHESKRDNNYNEDIMFGK